MKGQDSVVRVHYTMKYTFGVKGERLASFVNGNDKCIRLDTFVGSYWYFPLRVLLYSYIIILVYWGTNS